MRCSRLTLLRRATASTATERRAYMEVAKGLFIEADSS